MMPGACDKNFNRLITSLYDAALDGAQLPFAIEQIAHAFEATTLLLQVQDVQAGSTTILPFLLASSGTEASVVRAERRS